MRRLGILLNEKDLRSCLKGRPIFERIALYKRAARRMDVEVCFFDWRGLFDRRSHVRGYRMRPDGKLQAVRVRRPAVIHQRGVFSSSFRRRMARLSVRGVTFFNPPFVPDKYQALAAWAADPDLRPHTPVTMKLRPGAIQEALSLVRSWGDAILKPQNDSGGRGVYRFRLRGGLLVVENRKGVRRYPAAQLSAWLRRLARRRFLLQRRIELAQREGRPFDVRVSVQRDGSGAWTVPGAVVKRAGKRSFLTNLCRGGTAHRLDETLAMIFPPQQVRRIQSDLERVALLAAQSLERRWRGLADLGLDIGIDHTGHPWLLEVNTRDQRYSFLRAGEKGAFDQMYANAVAYGCRLLDGRGPAR